VYNVLTNTTESTSQRISKSGKLKDKVDYRIQTISERVGSMTGMSIKTAEVFHLTSYGIGGHYEPHYDFVSIKEQSTFKKPVTGNRVATVLFYVSAACLIEE
jgi:prolyl 4-hydroxylase